MTPSNQHSAEAQAKYPTKGNHDFEQLARQEGFDAGRVSALSSQRVTDRETVALELSKHWQSGNTFEMPNFRCACGEPIVLEGSGVPAGIPVGEWRMMQHRAEIVLALGPLVSRVEVEAAALEAGVRTAVEKFSVYLSPTVDEAEVQALIEAARIRTGEVGA